MEYGAPWWNLGLGIWPSLFILFNIGMTAIVFGGFIYFLLKVSSIDKTLKEIFAKLDRHE